MLGINRLKIWPRFHAKPVIQAQISLGKHGEEERDGVVLLDCLLQYRYLLPSPRTASVSLWLTPEIWGALTSIAAAALTCILHPTFGEPNVPICLPGSLGQDCP